MSGVPTSKPRVTVIGAGFSGLIAAWQLEKDGFDVTVLEKAARPGGLIATLPHPQGLVETAANGMLATKRVEDLFADLKLEIQTPKKSARRRYLAVGGRVTRFPLTLAETFTSLLKIARAGKVPPQAQETLLSWAERALGPAFARKIVAPAVLGIYAADADRLSANLIVGRFYDKSRRRNKKGRLRGTVTAPGGLGVLIETLYEVLESRGVQFHHDVDGASVSNLFSNQDPVVIATPAWAAADILKKIAPRDPRRLSLARIQSVPLISMTLFFNRKPSRLGFGTLFAQIPPHGTSDGILGCIQASEIFEGRVSGDVHAETWILGGAGEGARMVSESDEELIGRILAKRDQLIDSKSQEAMVGEKVTRWPQAIPLYDVKLETSVTDLRQDQNGIVLFGNYLGDLGLASILESARDLGTRVKNSGEKSEA